MKENSILSVIFFGLCAVIWSVKAICELADMPYPTTNFLLVLDVVCAICWIAAFIVQLIKYIKSGKEE